MTFSKIWGKGIVYLKSTISTMQHHFLISMCRAFAFETLDIYVLQGVLLINIFDTWFGLWNLFHISFITWVRVIESNLIQYRLWILMWNKIILFYNISATNKLLRLHVTYGTNFIYKSEEFYQKALVHQVEVLGKASGFGHFSFCKNHFRKD